MSRPAFEETRGASRLQGNANPTRQEILFPTQSDGRKVKEPGDTKLLERPQGRGHQWAPRREGARSRAGAEDTQPRTLAERPGGTSMVLIHSTPSKCGLMDGAGAGHVGASFLCFLMQEAWARSLGWEDPLEKGMATHSGILTWRIPWTV